MNTTHRRRLCRPIALVLLASAPAAQLGSWVVGHQRISDTRGEFGGSLADGDTFGISSAGMGDLDGDGQVEVAVGAQFDDGAGLDRGAIWMLTLDATGKVLRETKIGDATGGFAGALSDGDLFGHALAALGDVDGDGVCDLATSSLFDDDGGKDRGAAWILFLNPDGTVKGERKISSTTGGLVGPLDDDDLFGVELEGPGDLDGNGVPDLLVGAYNDDDGGQDRGALWILYLAADGTVTAERKISQTAGGFGGTLANGDQFGAGIAMLEDLDGDGTRELAVGSHASDEAGDHSGSVWILFLAPDESVVGQQKISAIHGGFGGKLGAFDLFGLNLGLLDDLDGDGVRELGVSAVLDDAGGMDQGALWVLFLEPDGTVRAQQKIAEGRGGFGGNLKSGDHFGRPEPIGDIDGNGVLDLAVGATGTDDGGPDRGAVWILRMTTCVPASVAPRAGSGVNPSILTSLAGPVVGTSWDVDLDTTGHAPGCALVLGTSAPAVGPLVGAGEILVDLVSARLVRLLVPHGGGPTSFAIPVPADVTLCGTTASFQALVLGTTPRLSNALDVVVGS